MGLTVDVLRERDRFAALEPEWWDLWRRAEATPFGSPAWALPWWDAFSPGELHVLVARRDGRLCALAPFYLDEHGYARPVGVSVSDYHDALVDPDTPEALDALADAMARALRMGVTGFELPEAPPGAAALKLAPEARIERGEQSPCPVLVATASLFDAIPAQKRRKLRMAEHRAERAGGGVIARREGDAVMPAFEALATLHALRWAEEGGGVLGDARVLRFHRAALPRLDQAGLLDLFALEVEGEVAGAYYGLRDARRAYAYLGGYDPRFALLSPGARLMAHAIRAADERGAREFHFLRGAEAYKYEWGATDRMNTRSVFTPVPVPADA